MKNMTKAQLFMTAAIAGMVGAQAGSPVAHAADKIAPEETVLCKGASSCAGKGACGATRGKNDCAGHGNSAMSKADCDEKKLESMPMPKAKKSDAKKKTTEKTTE